MRYIEFEKKLRNYIVFSIKDITKVFPDLDSRRLVEWQEKGYILKIRRGYYCFSERRKDERFLYFSANKIYSASYVSFESALAYYNLIPEAVFVTLSATTRNTADFETPVGNFGYKHIKPLLFWGYKLVQDGDVVVKIAEPEKALLDYFYIRKLNIMEDIEEMRLNPFQLKEIADPKKLETYAQVFESDVMRKRVQLLIKWMNA
ncbi:MAG: hypothetical protein SF052_15845 [Bacteroidia bacterium]|nr:hypothetical protein [Bacteroidia bacterium]